MITRFSTLYVGHIELERCGIGGMPVDDRRYSNERLVEAFEKEMKDAGASVKIVTYPNAKHSFTNPDADAAGTSRYVLGARVRIGLCP